MNYINLNFGFDPSPKAAGSVNTMLRELSSSKMENSHKSPISSPLDFDRKLINDLKLSSKLSVKLPEGQKGRSHQVFFTQKDLSKVV